LVKRRIIMCIIILAFRIALVATAAPDTPQPCEWSALAQGVDNSVSELRVIDAGTGLALYAGGSFQAAGGKLAFGVARWDGESWSALGHGLRSGIVAALVGFDDGRGRALYAGGSFETSGATIVRGIARWDGLTWSEVGGGIAGAPSSKPAVSSFAVFDDGTGEALYVGGSFGSAGETPETAFIARWDGQSWSPVGDGLGGIVSDLLVFNDGAGPALYATGTFERARGGPADYIAKWDGQTWSEIGGGLNKRGMALAGFDDGRGSLYTWAGSLRRLVGRRRGISLGGTEGPGRKSEVASMSLCRHFTSSMMAAGRPSMWAAD
jgi:trimeric autotransporter adhesin